MLEATGDDGPGGQQVDVVVLGVVALVPRLGPQNLAGQPKPLVTQLDADATVRAVPGRDSRVERSRGPDRQDGQGGCLAPEHRFDAIAEGRGVDPLQRVRQGVADQGDVVHYPCVGAIDKKTFGIGHTSDTFRYAAPGCVLLGRLPA